MNPPPRPQDSNILVTTARLILRRVEPDDQALLQCLFCDAEMMRFLGGTWSLAQAREALEEWRSAWGVNNYYYGVEVRKDTDEAIGIAGFTENTNPHEPGLEFSWFILPEHQKQGFATELTRAILAFAFEHLQVDRTFAETHPGNVASNRVLEKLGFVFAGERSNEYDDLPGFKQQVVWEYHRLNWVEESQSKFTY